MVIFPLPEPCRRFFSLQNGVGRGKSWLFKKNYHCCFVLKAFLTAKQASYLLSEWEAFNWFILLLNIAWLFACIILIEIHTTFFNVWSKNARYKQFLILPDGCDIVGSHISLCIKDPDNVYTVGYWAPAPQIKVT